MKSINSNFIIGKIDNEKNVHKDSTENGYVYKNSFEFNKKSNGVCYIPENSNKQYNYWDFLKIAKESIKMYEWNITSEDLAQNLFDCVDWQHPETLIEDWSNYDMFD